MKTSLLTLIAFFFINIGYTQAILGASDNTDAKVESALNTCGCSDLIIPNGVTINMSDQWDLRSKNISLSIKGSGSLVFSGNGSSRDELHLSATSIITIERTTNMSALIASGGGGQVRIVIGSTIFKGKDLSSIITAGGANQGGVLPITLSYFNGFKKGSHIELIWETASEKNNERIEILRSKDLKTWEVIGEVKGHGTTNDFTEYSFIDNSPKSGDMYYKLKQYDYNGEAEEHDIIAVEFLLEIGVYPNPSAGDLTIHLQEFDRNEEFNYEITDMSRSIVSSGVVNGEQTNLNLDLENGIYILRVYNAGTSYNVKVLVEKN